MMSAVRTVRALAIGVPPRPLGAIVGGAPEHPPVTHGHEYVPAQYIAARGYSPAGCTDTEMTATATVCLLADPAIAIAIDIMTATATGTGTITISIMITIHIIFIIFTVSTDIVSTIISISFHTMLFNSMTITNTAPTPLPTPVSFHARMHGL